MVSLLENSKIAIVGGGEFCLELLQTLYRETQWTRRPEVIGVADINEKAVGFLFAKEKGIFTTTNYNDFFTMAGINMISGPGMLDFESCISLEKLVIDVEIIGMAKRLIGGIAETQEMLDYCGEHGIVSDVEIIRADQINEAYERVLKGDVRYRFVIDVASLKGE